MQNCSSVIGIEVYFFLWERNYCKVMAVIGSLSISSIYYDTMTEVRFFHSRLISR